MRIPRRPPALAALVEKMGAEKLGQILIGSGLSSHPEDAYPHWDKLRHMPSPVEGYTHEEWWAALKFSRGSSMRLLPFKDEKGESFRFNLPPFVLRLLHLVDRHASGRIEVPKAITNPHTRDRFLVRSLIEEAITSSQLEGAATTRKDAKEMLRQGRKPRTLGERMILNNFHAMEFIRESYGTPLSDNLLMELHSILTRDTLDDLKAVARWRRPDERIRVVDQRDETVLHVPPPAEELPERMKKLYEFANGDDQPFIHPVLKAIIVHFMIGYDHPFVDGNGRTARALFYWSMANHKYWMMEFTSISTILRNAPSKYARAYLYTETDDNDVTYFIIYQLEVILRAIESLHDYIARKTSEYREADSWLRSSENLRSILNHRQVAVIHHALKHAYERYTIRSHMVSHDVTYETARSDLLDLARHGLLEQGMQGRAYIFTVPNDLKARLNTIRGTAQRLSP
jgi:Fic family protein